MATTEQINFWEYSDDKKRSLYNKINKEMKIDPKAAEKDWWVCHVIHALFSLRCADALTFKGGTSLSKAWGITERFSEDVDISFDKSFFGLSGDTRSARDRIRKLSRKYIHETVWEELSATIRVFGAEQCETLYRSREDSDADPTVLLVPYHSVLPAHPYIKETVKIEFSCRSPREPREMRTIVPFAAQLSPMIDFPETAVPTVTPVRTFLEKVFLLHEEFRKDHPRHRRMSRHLYDLWKMDQAGYADRAIADTAFYASLVEHRPENLSILPQGDLLPLWEADYKSMQDQFIYGESPSFPELLKSLEGIQSRLREMKI